MMKVLLMSGLSSLALKKRLNGLGVEVQPVFYDGFDEKDEAFLCTQAAMEYKPDVIYLGSTEKSDRPNFDRHALSAVCSTISGRECQIVKPWIMEGLTRPEVYDLAINQGVDVDEYLPLKLTSGNCSEEVREYIHRHYNATSDVEIFMKFGL